MQFKGYRRPDGKVGIRNQVLILPSVVCANRAARGISQAVMGTTWVEHQHGCTQLGMDAELTARVLVAHGTHPNVSGVIVVGLGCETIRAQDIAAEIKKQCPYKNVATIIIQDEGGSVKAISAGASFAREFVGAASSAASCGASCACAATGKANASALLPIFRMVLADLFVMPFMLPCSFPEPSNAASTFPKKSNSLHYRQIKA